MESVSNFLFSLKAMWLPDWLVSIVLLALAALVAWWLHDVAYRVLARIVSGKHLFQRSLVQRTRGPALLAAIMVAIVVAVPAVPLTYGQAAVLRHATIVGIIILSGWFLLTVLHVWTVVYLRRFKLDSEDNLLARKHVTQTRVLERSARVLIVVVTLGAAMMTFDSIRQYGVSLIASAGVASLVVGLALQPLLKNLLAGVQLAITQPIRIDDALLVEGEWGNVEEITSSYVVVRLWDWPRLIVPLSYFIEKPFQNWTRESSALIGQVLMYVDFSVPVSELRRKFEEIVRGSRLWDGRVVVLQVTDFRETTMEIRMLMSANSSPKAFDLRCEVREKMLEFVQQRYPKRFPGVGPISAVDGPGRRAEAIAGQFSSG